MNLIFQKLGGNARAHHRAGCSSPTFYRRRAQGRAFVNDLKEQDRTTEIELTVDNEALLTPVGASADIEVVTETRESAGGGSVSAVLGRGELRHVFVDANGSVQKRTVSIGLSNYLTTEIRSGVVEGEERESFPLTRLSLLTVCGSETRIQPP